jgi:hypothetical protein
LVEVIGFQELFERRLFFRNQEKEQVCPKKHPFVRKLSEFDLEIGRHVEKVVPPGRLLDEIERGAVVEEKILQYFFQHKSFILIQKNLTECNLFFYFLKGMVGELYWGKRPEGVFGQPF